ncbi:hypothetical protein D3C76_1411320 [compost metagenome]
MNFAVTLPLGSITSCPRIRVTLSVLSLSHCSQVLVFLLLSQGAAPELVPPKRFLYLDFGSLGCGLPVGSSNPCALAFWAKKSENA